MWWAYSLRVWAQSSFHQGQYTLGRFASKHEQHHGQCCMVSLLWRTQPHHFIDLFIITFISDIIVVNFLPPHLQGLYLCFKTPGALLLFSAVLGLELDFLLCQLGCQWSFSPQQWHMKSFAEKCFQPVVCSWVQFPQPGVVLFSVYGVDFWLTSHAYVMACFGFCSQFHPS